MMLSLADIETALSEAVEAERYVYPIAWPNRTIDPPRPFLMFQHVPTNWTDNTMEARTPRAEGYITITIVRRANEFSTPANQMADYIMRAFPMGRRIQTRAGVTVLINRPPRPMMGMMDGADWRQPVQIFYVTEGRIVA